jgi:hypothetical protein
MAMAAECVEDVRRMSMTCSACGWTPRQEMACEHCGHVDARPERPVSPSRPPAGASVDDLYRNASATGTNLVCTRCSGPLDWIGDAIQCSICGPVNPTPPADPHGRKQQAPQDLSHLRCYGASDDGEPCEGQLRVAINDFDASGRMMPAKLVCQNCGSAAEFPEPPVQPEPLPLPLPAQQPEPKRSKRSKRGAS